MSYTSEAALGQESERALEEVKAEARPLPQIKGNPWLGIAALAVFLYVLYRGRRPQGFGGAGKASW